MSRWAHDQGDCNGDHTCVWCWNEMTDDDTNNDTEQGDNE
jgi:hypothetical protein